MSFNPTLLVLPMGCTVLKYFSTSTDEVRFKDMAGKRPSNEACAVARGGTSICGRLLPACLVSPEFTIIGGCSCAVKPAMAQQLSVKPAQDVPMQMIEWLLASMAFTVAWLLLDMLCPVVGECCQIGWSTFENASTKADMADSDSEISELAE